MTPEETTCLHQTGYVHGDLCDTNIMVRKNGQSGFMLVDFDWVGKIGEVCYPMNVNTNPALGCPAGAYDGEVIKANHDMDMLQKISEGSNDLEYTLLPFLSVNPTDGLLFSE
jgi:hypothetical protein